MDGGAVQSGINMKESRDTKNQISSTLCNVGEIWVRLVSSNGEPVERLGHLVQYTDTTQNRQRETELQRIHRKLQRHPPERTPELPGLQ